MMKGGHAQGVMFSQRHASSKNTGKFLKIVIWQLQQNLDLGKVKVR